MSFYWNKIKGRIKELVPEAIFKVWFSPIEGEVIEDKLFLKVPNEFTKTWIKENYHHIIEQVLKEFELKGIEFLLSKSHLPEQLILPYNPISVIGRGFSPKYTFEDFVVGKCNELAFKVCYQIAEEIPKGYLVYLCGNFGLGKTHLTQAVGNGLYSKGFNKVYYFTAQDFLNSMIKYLRSGMLETFKEKIRMECEILLLEEVHFLAGKEYTQNELVFLLDRFLDEGKTVILTSLKLPQEIQKMESSLRSRLSSGLIIKLGSPDFATRKKIIKYKAKKKGYEFPYEIVEFLARNLRGDVRQIESAVLGLIARSSMLKEPISLSLAKEVINELGVKEDSNQVELIVELVCKFFGISKDDFFSSSRKKEFTLSRQIVMYFLRKIFKMPFKDISKLFKKEHSTIIYNINTLEEKLYKDTGLKIKIDYLWREISKELQDKDSEVEYDHINESETSP